MDVNVVQLLHIQTYTKYLSNVLDQNQLTLLLIVLIVNDNNGDVQMWKMISKCVVSVVSLLLDQ